MSSQAAGRPGSESWMHLPGAQLPNTEAAKPRLISRGLWATATAGRARCLLLLLLLLSSRQGHHACGDEGRGDVRRIVALVRGLKGRLGGRAGRQPQAAGVKGLAHRPGRPAGTGQLTDAGADGDARAHQGCSTAIMAGGGVGEMRGEERQSAGMGCTAWRGGSGVRARSRASAPQHFNFAVSASLLLKLTDQGDDA
jgi:hypothetical protein